MSLSEADTRAKLIDPALHARGWTEDLLRREGMDGAVEITDGKPRNTSVCTEITTGSRSRLFLSHNLSWQACHHR